jgi:hypothetical protein
MKNFFSKVKMFFLNLKEKCIKGYKWVGTDGLLNFESSALLIILLLVFFPFYWATALTFFIVMFKCSLDKTRGRKGELHDFICSILGILIGIILFMVI